MANEPTPVVPTLHAMTTPQIKNPQDVAAYLIRWLFVNPGRTSSVAEGEMISYRKLVAEYSQRPEEMASRISSMLTASMGHYFPKANYAAECTIEDAVGYDKDDGTYQGNKSIKIAMHDADGIAIIPLASIIVDPDGIHFTIAFGEERK